MLIRQVEEGDIERLVALCELHAVYEKSSYDPSGKVDKLHYQLFIESNLQCLVVESQKKLHGYATFIKQFSTWDADHYLYLDCLYLKEEIRGNGLGSKLMEEVKSYAKEQECFQVQWQTPAFNERAIDFYKKLGAVSKEKERFFWPLSKKQI